MGSATRLFLFFTFFILAVSFPKLSTLHAVLRRLWVLVLDVLVAERSADLVGALKAPGGRLQKARSAASVDHAAEEMYTKLRSAVNTPWDCAKNYGLP